MTVNELFIGGLGPWELIIILVVILILFGGRKIPQLAKDLGSGIREFRKSLSGTAEELDEQMKLEDVEPKKPSTPRKKSGTKKTGRS